ncbi:FHA domain-containing protein, partial [Corynebacterium sp. MSK006]
AAAAAPADQAGSSGASASTAGRWREEPTDSAARSEPAQPAAATATVSLLLQDGSSRTYHVHEGSNILGRSTTADFRLPDTGVSREHAELSWNGHDAVLTDLKSTNGTTVNDTPVDNWLLDDGDVITMGHSRIEVRIVRPGN